MSDFKQALRSTAVFLLLALLMSAGILFYYFRRGLFSFQDAGIRQELAGQLDLLICGASYGEVSMNPEILDEALGTTSYNLGSPRLLLHGRTWLLRKELERNPVKTVLLEVSLDTLGLDEEKPNYARGETRMIARLDTPSERWEYFKTYVPAENMEECVSVSLRYGVASLLGRAVGVDKLIEPRIRGFRTNPLSDQTLSVMEVERSHDSKAMDAPRQANLDEIQTMMDLCRKHGARVIVVVTPTTSAFHWVTAGEQECYDALAGLCEKNGAVLLNFDLDRQRYALYSDGTSFSDRYHLCGSAAEVFSRRLAETLQLVLDGQDVSDRFYEDYAGMEADSPYAA